MADKVKKKPKTVEKVSPKEIADRISGTAKSMVTQINKLEDPEFTTMQRGKSNVISCDKRDIPCGSKFRSDLNPHSGKVWIKCFINEFIDNQIAIDCERSVVK